MHRMISGLVAAIAVVTVSAAPAMACGGVFGGSCYVPATTYAGCNAGCWGYERLPDPVLQYGAVPYAGPQYYYVNQGPTYTGPGNFAPYPFYQEGAVSGRDAYRRSRYHYGHAPRHYGHHQYTQRRDY